MKKKEFFYLSADGKTNIHAVMWLPDEKPKAILQISHGVTEYILRYERFANYLTDKGFIIVGNDHLGHGMSISKESKPMYFGPVGSWDYVVEDIKKCMEITKSEFGELPYFLLGFSLGSFVVRTFLIKYPQKINGVIVIGTGKTPDFQISLAKFVANLEAKKVGEDNTSPMIKKLTFDTYNKLFAPNKTDYDWLCSNDTALKEYIDDKNRGGNLSAGLFREMLDGMTFTGKQENINKMDKDTPIILLSGDKDQVGDSGKGVQKFFKCLKKAGIKNVTMKLYKDLRHDILHEKIKDEVYEDVYHFMEENMK